MDYTFSVFAKFSENSNFLTLDTFIFTCNIIYIFPQLKSNIIQIDDQR